MNYHLIRTDDMLNGDGLRVIIFISGCSHHCDGCHNPETWDLNSGKPFTVDSLNQILEELNKDYISGITFSGGDPLKRENLPDVHSIINTIKETFPQKNIWLYTGYTLKISDFYKPVDTKTDGSLLRSYILANCDVVCDGKFVKSLADVNCPWVGSTNQRVIDVQKSIEKGEIVLHES